MFRCDVEGMRHLKQHAREVYDDKITSMRENYHTQKMTDDSRTLDLWERQDRWAETLFLALEEKL